MDRKKASDYPQELLDLFHQYVHGDISRRGFLEGAGKFAVGGLTAAAIFESLKPNYAWAQQVQKDDKRIKTEYATVPSPQGNGSIKGYLARPASGSKLPGVLVVHENRGLNPYIEDIARRLAVANFVAFAPDGLTSVGGYPGDDEKGGAESERQEVRGVRVRGNATRLPQRHDAAVRRSRRQARVAADARLLQQEFARVVATLLETRDLKKHYRMGESIVRALDGVSM